MQDRKPTEKEAQQTQHLRHLERVLMAPLSVQAMWLMVRPFWIHIAWSLSWGQGRSGEWVSFLGCVLVLFGISVGIVWYLFV